MPSMGSVPNEASVDVSSVPPMWDKPGGHSLMALNQGFICGCFEHQLVKARGNSGIWETYS